MKIHRLGGLALWLGKTQTKRVEKGQNKSFGAGFRNRHQSHVGDFEFARSLPEVFSTLYKCTRGFGVQ